MNEKLPHPLKLARFVKFREEKFGGVLFETRQEKVFTLNPTGAAVVKELTAGHEDVVARLNEKFQDPSGTLAADVGAFLDCLKAAGLLAESP